VFPVSRPAVGFGFLTLLILLGPSSGLAQDEKPEEVKNKEAEKKATQLLLQRAEEEYRIFFRKPETVPQFWAAMKLEVSLGKFDLAALHLKLLLQKEPAEDTDKELLKIEEAEGLSSFLKLQTIRKWSGIPSFQEEADKNVKTLIDRVTAALEKYLSDPERINKFIKKLDAGTVEERAYAFVQIKRSRERAVPYLVETLRTGVGTPLHGRVVEAMLKLDPEIVPPLLETLKAANLKDAEDLDLRMTILDIVKRRADKRALPYLWHLSSAARYPDQIKRKARDVLAYFLETEPSRLPPAKVALTEMAEKYYQHKVRFFPGRPVRLWPWNGQQLSVKPVELTPSQAEEFFGLRYAREALDLDPKHQPAQIVLLSLMLERTLGPDLDQVLLRPTPPKLQQLLATVDAELLTLVLERALNERNYPIIVATIQALGERGESRAAKLAASGTPRGVIRALHYPDRRVQFAAVKAMLRMPSAPVPVASARMVDILRRNLIAGAEPKALVAFFPTDKAQEVRQAVKQVGLEPVLVKSGKEIFERLARTSDYDAVFLGTGMNLEELPFLMANLRADVDQGQLPVLIFASKEKREALAKLAERYRNVKVYPEVLLAMADELKNSVDNQIKEASGTKLTAAERKAFAQAALDIFWRMAKGEIQGYDLRPAQDAVVEAQRNPDMTLEALEILGRLPGQEPQARLAAVVLNLGQGKQRVPAAIELNRHIQKYGVMLDKAQTTGLKAAFKNADEEPALRAQLALLIGSMRPSAQATGVRLFEFRPDAPAPPPEKKEKEKEKEKEAR
jgi:hypothetical protein